MKLWKGRFQKEADPKTNDFNSSISIDSRMYKEDIEGSIAHATMLGACGIIAQSESDKICAELEKIVACAMLPSSRSIPTPRTSTPSSRAS